MSCQAVIVDTNVVGAGPLTEPDASPGLADSACILDGMLTAAFVFVVSKALLAECRTVLVRPNLRKLHGLAVTQVEASLTDRAQHAIVLTPIKAPPDPDPCDQLFWELLSDRANVLRITGDKPLVKDADLHGRVISARELLAVVLPS